MVKVPPERVKVPPMVMLPSAVKLPEDIVRLSLLYELLEAVRLPRKCRECRQRRADGWWSCRRSRSPCRPRG